MKAAVNRHYQGILSSKNYILHLQPFQDAGLDAFQLLGDLLPHALLHFFPIRGSDNSTPFSNCTATQMFPMGRRTLTHRVDTSSAATSSGPRKKQFAEPEDPGQHSCGFTRQFTAKHQIYSHFPKMLVYYLRMTKARSDIIDSNRQSRVLLPDVLDAKRLE